MVRTLAGRELAPIRCGPSSTISDIKSRVARLTGSPASEQKLIFEGVVLQDGDELSRCLPAPPPGPGSGEVTVSMHVVLARSGIAGHLERMASAGDETQACLVDVVDSVMQFEANLSQLARPPADGVARSIAPQHRGELIRWMVEAFGILDFDDGLLHSVILNFDRFCACREARSMPVMVDSVQRVLLATVCLELKLACDDDFPPGYCQRILDHLSHGALKLSSILAAEYEVLVELEFRVGTPTAVTFLTEFCLRLPAGEERDRAYSLALLLLELVLFEPRILYGTRHPPLLAAGALGAALRALGAPRERREALLEDLATSCPEMKGSADGSVLDTEEELVGLWHAASTGACPCSRFSAALVRKFQAPSRYGVSKLSAAASLELLKLARPALGNPACAGLGGGRGAGGGPGRPRLLEGERHIMVC